MVGASMDGRRSSPSGAVVLQTAGAEDDLLQRCEGVSQEVLGALPADVQATSAPPSAPAVQMDSALPSAPAAQAEARHPLPPRSSFSWHIGCGETISEWASRIDREEEERLAQAATPISRPMEEEASVCMPAPRLHSRIVVEGEDLPLAAVFDAPAVQGAAASISAVGRTSAACSSSSAGPSMAQSNPDFLRVVAEAMGCKPRGSSKRRTD